MNIYKNLLYLHGYLLPDDAAPDTVSAVRPVGGSAGTVRAAVAAPMPATPRPSLPVGPAPTGRAAGCPG